MLTIKFEWISTSVQKSTRLLANTVSTFIFIVWLIKHYYLYSTSTLKSNENNSTVFLSYFWSSLRLIILKVNAACLFIFLCCQGSAFKYCLRKSLQYAVSTANQIHLENTDVADLKLQKYIQLWLISAVFLTVHKNK